VNDDDASTTTSFELVIIFLHHFSQPLCIVISFRKCQFQSSNTGYKLAKSKVQNCLHWLTHSALSSIKHGVWSC